MTHHNITDLSPTHAQLVAKAQEATALSYSPYSHFQVGAALFLANGQTVCGANQENASYPVGICAERTTLATAQNLYPGVPPVALALAARDASGNLTESVVTPCGMCRQAMAEVEQRYHVELTVLMCSSSSVTVAKGVKELLPLAFN